MASGSHRKISEWEKWQRRLAEERCRYRMHKKTTTPFILIREYVDGKVAKEFSSRHWRHESDADIKACAEKCLEAHRKGWANAVGPVAAKGKGHTWITLMDAFWAKYSERVVREGSQADHRSYCRQCQTFSGPVRTERLEAWINQTDPYRQWSKHRKQFQFLSDLKKYGFMGGEAYDLMLERQNARRPTKQERERVTGGQKPRAIPSDQVLYEWLKAIERPLHQWAFAMVAVYGLRPSELWHLNGINEAGFVMVPAKPLCKTFRHPALACPIDWIEEFGLRKNFDHFHAEWIETYQIKWAQGARGMEPLNNSRVADAGLGQQLTRGKVKPLKGASWDAGPESDEDAPCMVYDLRHAYAIRLFTHPETRHLTMEKHAFWMGHSLQQHKNTYLKWMPEDLLMRSEIEAFTESASQAVNTITPAKDLVEAASTSAEMATLMAELEKLKRQNAKQRKMIDALQDED